MVKFSGSGKAPVAVVLMFALLAPALVLILTTQGEVVSASPEWTTPSSVHSMCGQETENDNTKTIDSDTGTHWHHNATCAHHITFDMGETKTITKIRIYQSDAVQNSYWGGGPPGGITTTVYVSDDPESWGDSVWSGDMADMQGSDWFESGSFGPSTGRYIKLVTSSDGAQQCMFEFQAYTTSAYPALYLPENEEVIPDNTPRFEWTEGEGADNHRLLVDNDSDFSSPDEENRIIVGDNSYTIADENLLPDDNYFWKVIAISEGGENSSNVWTFEVISDKCIDIYLEDAGTEDEKWVNYVRMPDNYMEIKVELENFRKIENVVLKWYDNGNWENYDMDDIGENFWFENMTGLENEKLYSFDVWARDSEGNEDTYEWLRKDNTGNQVRRYIGADYAITDNLLYEQFFLWEAHYYSENVGDPDKAVQCKHCLEHEQAPDGSDWDTGYLHKECPENLEERYCGAYLGFYINENMTINPLIIDNIYIHVWWRTTDNETEFHYDKETHYMGYGSFLDSIVVDENTAQHATPGMYLGGGVFAYDDYFLEARFWDVTDTTYNSSDIYQFSIGDFTSGDSDGPSWICSRNYASFIILNIPDNTTLQGMDSDSDGWSDYDELYTHYTNPFEADTDGDDSNDPEDTFPLDYWPGINEVYVTDIDNVLTDNLYQKTPYKFWVEIEDPENLSDIENVMLKVYLDNVDLPDSVENHYTFLFVNTTGVWSSSPSDYIITENCVAGDNSKIRDNYIFVIKFENAQYTGNDNWDIWVNITDIDGEFTDNEFFENKFDITRKWRLVETWTVFMPATGYEGSGTVENPYLIPNVEMLQKMNDDKTAHYALDNEIDASGTIGWNDGTGFTPIGDSTNKFTGSLDGRGYIVYNLHVNRDNVDYMGLFGWVGSGGIVENMGMENENIVGSNYVGGLVGYNDGIVSKCYSDGSVVGDNYTGGLVGFNTGTVSNSYSTNSVTGYSDVGGLVGHNDDLVDKSYSVGFVTGYYNVGGIVGYEISYVEPEWQEVGTWTNYAEIPAGPEWQEVGTWINYIDAEPPALEWEEVEVWTIYTETPLGPEWQEVGVWTIHAEVPSGPEWQEVETWTNYPDVGDLTLYENYVVAIPDMYTWIYGDNHWRAQTFTVGATGHTVTIVKIKAYREGSPGTLTLGIRTTDGGGHPTGSDLTSGTINANTFTTNTLGEWYAITVTEYDLSSSTKYAIVLRALSGTNNNEVNWLGDYTSPAYTGGNLESSSDNGSSWTTYTEYDMMFEIWGFGGTVSDSFYDSQTSGQSDTGKGDGKTTTQMHLITTFSDAGWDIVLIQDYDNEIWYIDNGSDYPKLGWQWEAFELAWQEVEVWTNYVNVLYWQEVETWTSYPKISTWHEVGIWTNYPKTPAWYEVGTWTNYLGMEAIEWHEVGTWTNYLDVAPPEWQEVETWTNYLDAAPPGWYEVGTWTNDIDASEELVPPMEQASVWTTIIRILGIIGFLGWAGWKFKNIDDPVSGIEAGATVVVAIIGIVLIWFVAGAIGQVAAGL